MNSEVLPTGWAEATVKELCGQPQYGYTESATPEAVGPKFLRITDIQDGDVNWNSVPYCRCDETPKYRLADGDILFARTGGTTGKSYLVRKPPEAVFASYLIRIRPGERVLPEFVWLYFQSSGYWASVFGGINDSNRPNMNGSKLGLLRVPFPRSKTEQRRVVARVEALTSRLDQTRALRHQIGRQVEALLRAILNSDKNPKPTRMRDLVKLRSSDVIVRAEETYQFAGVYCFGRGVFKSAAKLGRDFAYARLTRLRAGDFVYPKLMAWEGALGMVPPECDGCVVSTEFPVFEVDSSRIFPEVLDVYFRTPSVWPELADLSVGTNVRRRRLNPQAFLDYEMALPSRETQIRLRSALAKQTELRRLQTETEAELAAFTTALLAKAFHGEL